MTALAVVVCVALVSAAWVASVVLVLRYLAEREARKSAQVAASVEAQLREALRVVDSRLSKLELQRVMR